MQSACTEKALIEIIKGRRSSPCTAETRPRSFLYYPTALARRIFFSRGGNGGFALEAGSGVGASGKSVFWTVFVPLFRALTVVTAAATTQPGTASWTATPPRSAKRKAPQRWPATRRRAQPHLVLPAWKPVSGQSSKDGGRYKDNSNDPKLWRHFRYLVFPQQVTKRIQAPPLPEVWNGEKRQILRREVLWEMPLSEYLKALGPGRGDSTVQ